MKPGIGFKSKASSSVKCVKLSRLVIHQIMSDFSVNTSLVGWEWGVFGAMNWHSHS